MDLAAAELWPAAGGEVERTMRIVATAVTRNSSMSRPAKMLRTKYERFAVSGASLVVLPPDVMDSSRIG